MLEKGKKNHLHVFKKKYAAIFAKFLLNTDENSYEYFLHEGYKLGRTAINDKITLLDLTSIHHSILINILEALTTGNHIGIVEKANVFFEEVLGPFEMVSKEFREAIKLLNRSSVEFAIHIHSLREEIANRKKIEEELLNSQGQYRTLAEELQASLKEKEALLKEVYHRVKNNLQVITSLINLQLDTIKDGKAKRALAESGARVKAMALVHEMLYQSKSLAEITMDEYIAKLLVYLYEIYNVDANKIKYELNTESVLLNIDKSITLGLIVNEIISNALKHAFSGKKNGKIHLRLQKKNNKITIVIGDNGVGIPPDLDTEKINSLGMRLIYNLSKQLNAKISLNRKNGTEFTITFEANRGDHESD